tara:strand:- start:68 stop:1909 length:1842 start_codon:yes stop_codon:yes gene_type:complete
MTNTKRLDLEFLRGFAVIIVFFFHYNAKLFNNFFVGVDIFFLLSGYVISSSIFSNKKFNLSSYYLRRIKRIYPNLIFILTIFIISFFLFYSYIPSDFDNNFFSVIFSFFGVSNLYYNLNPNFFYFSQELKWLVHTWSLSIEIQYYLIFGLLCFLIHKLFKNYVNLIKYTKIIIIFIFISSFLLFCFYEIKYLSDYYSFPGRIWEFMLGSLAFFFQKEKKHNFNYFVLIYLSILIFINFFFPYINYKLTIIISLIYFYFVISYCKISNYSSLTNLIIFFGKISYSFYLWHLIIISFFKNSLNNSVLDFIFVFLITLLLSIFSYEFIEKKFNKKMHLDNFFKKTIKISIFFAIPIFSFYIIFFNQKLIFNSFDSLTKYSINFFNIVDKINNNNKNNFNEIFVKRFDKCENNYENFSWSTKVNCIHQNSNENLIYILGNSFGDHIIPAVSTAFPNETIYNARFENCYISNNLNCKNNNKILNQNISQYLKISKNYINKIIIFSLNQNNFSQKKISKITKNLVNDKTKILFFYPHPTVSTFANKEKFKVYNISKKNDLNLLESKKYKENIIVYDTFEHLCKKCNLKDYKELFINDDHFNLKGSLFLQESLKKLNLFN